MNIITTPLEGVVILEPDIIEDERGYFYESFREDMFRKEVCDTRFVQENQTSSRCGVLRGLHFQHAPYAQSKLVRVTKGRVLDVAVDLRKGSPSYGRYVMEELSEENHRQLFIPRGFAHGFLVLSEEATLQYKCDNYYNPNSEGSLLWCDPDLCIEWGVLESDVILSPRDQSSPRLKDINSPFLYGADLYE